MRLRSAIPLPPDSDRERASVANFAFHRNIAAHDIHHAPDQREPQPVALRSAGGVALIKLFKNMPPDFAAEAAAGIADAHHGHLPLGMKGQGHRTARRRELDSV